jgi:hypothetical protein
MDVGKRDKMANELASEAAGQFLREYEIGNKHVKDSPETVLQYTIPYLTVRMLHSVGDTLDRQEKALDRQEQALNSLEKDSQWIKGSAIITLFLTAVLACLTVVLAYYAIRLDVAIDEARQPTPPVASTPSPSP